MKVNFDDALKQLEAIHTIKGQYGRIYEADVARRVWSILKESQKLLNDEFFDVGYIQENCDNLASDAQTIKVQDLKEGAELRGSS